MHTKEHNKPNIPDLTQTTVNGPDTDYRAEVIAAALIEQGVDEELIEIIREGICRRGISTEVEKVSREYSVSDQLDYVCIRANKEGMYDMLPEGVFHQPIKKSLNKDREEILEEFKIHNQEEFFARRFFHLFELIADRTLTGASLFESKYNRKTTSPEFTELFIRYWPVLEMLTLKQGVFFMHIIPLLHKIRSHYKEVEQAFSYILEVPVRISTVILPAKKAARHFESILGESRLGVDLVLDKEFDDGIYDLKLTIGPISAGTMKNFLETSKGYRILESLCEIFLPAHVFVVKDFIIDPQDSSFILSDDTNTTYLGINSFI
jgi:hypothetical protein